MIKRKVDDMKARSRPNVSGLLHSVVMTLSFHIFMSLGLCPSMIGKVQMEWNEDDTKGRIGKELTGR